MVAVLRPEPREVLACGYFVIVVMDLYQLLFKLWLPAALELWGGTALWRLKVIRGLAAYRLLEVSTLWPGVFGF